MSLRICSFEQGEQLVLGFDTGLNAGAFARAGMTQFISNPGSVVFSDGRIEPWQPGGVMELGSESSKTMVVWGPHFPGEILLEIINNSDSRDEALAALRFWLRARTILENIIKNKPDATAAPYPGPAGALIVTKEQKGPYPYGTVFFPHGRLVKRCLEAEETVFEAEHWVHPDLEGSPAISFSAGAMLYRIFCGSPPFSGENRDDLRQNISEAFFIPPELAAPGLERDMADLISRTLKVEKESPEDSRRPSPDIISALIGGSPVKPASSWLKPLSEEENSRIIAEREHFNKKNTFKVKSRRFVTRNIAIITASLIAFAAILLSVRGIILHRSSVPSIKGMSPVEVAQTYYDAYNDLDHTMMSVCVSGNAGKDDINSVMSIYVISKVRQAYELQEILMHAREWIEAGRPPTDKTIFGITDFKLQIISLDNENAVLEADYILWSPGKYDEETASAAPIATATNDQLTLIYQKNLWRINNIKREK